jgi:hypothetical protein
MTEKDPKVTTAVVETKPAAGSKTRNRRSLYLAAALALFAVTFYVLTIVKMGPALFDRSL